MNITSIFRQILNLILLYYINHNPIHMKKIILITIGALMISISVNAQKMNAAKVPPIVKASFAKQFPSATDVKWEKEGKTYEVALKNKDQEMTVSLDAKGTLVETEVGIKSTELPAAVLKFVNDNFKGKTIQSVDKITAGSKVTYEVVVQKGKALIFDAKGKFLEKEKD